MWLTRYRRGQTAKEIAISEEETGAPFATVDRTNWLSCTLGRFKTNPPRILLPRDISFEYREHVKNLVRTYKKDDTGNMAAEYVNTGADHFAHSLCYADIGLALAPIGGSGAKTSEKSPNERLVMAESQTINLVDSRHPGYLSGMTDWAKWRLTYEGGDEFRDSYLERFSTREDQTDFTTRKAMTPVPKFARAAINDIRNAIYQRMRDVVRKGGSEVYQAAVNGNNLGVDHRGSTMNAFLGVKVLTELLVMGRVGVFVDHPLVPADATLAERPPTSAVPLQVRHRGHPFVDLLEARSPVRVPGNAAPRHGDAVRPGHVAADAFGRSGIATCGSTRIPAGSTCSSTTSKASRSINTVSRAAKSSWNWTASRS